MTANPIPQRAVSNLAIVILVLVAFIGGLAGSLAIRSPGKTLAAVGGGEGLAALESMEWNVPMAYPAGTPVIGDIMPEVVDIARRASGGLVALQLFEPGTLVPAFSISEAVGTGKVPAGYTWLGYDSGKILSSPLLSAAPFGLEPWEFMAWWYEGGGRELAEEIYAEHNIHPILCVVTSPEAAGWFHREINSITDFNGLRMRIAGLGGQVLQKFGAAVTVIPPGEIFPALERGVIDAAEFSMPMIDQRMGFDRVAKINYYPGWHQTFATDHLLVNKKLWDEINDANKAVIESACMAGVSLSLARSEALQGPAIADFEAKGVSVRQLPEDVLRELQRATQEVMAGQAAQDPMFKKVYESQQAFAAKYALWKRLGYLPRDF